MRLNMSRFQLDTTCSTARVSLVLLANITFTLPIWWRGQVVILVVMVVVVILVVVVVVIIMIISMMMTMVIFACIALS